MNNAALDWGDLLEEASESLKSIPSEKDIIKGIRMYAFHKGIRMDENLSAKIARLAAGLSMQDATVVISRELAKYE